jgi:hypothetical protein
MPATKTPIRMAVPRSKYPHHICIGHSGAKPKLHLWCRMRLGKPWLLACSLIVDVFDVVDVEVRLGGWSFFLGETLCKGYVAEGGNQSIILWRLSSSEQSLGFGTEEHSAGPDHDAGQCIRCHPPSLPRRQCKCWRSRR